MNENMTFDMEKDQENGQITYANEVVATIVSVATGEVEGISGITGASSISGILAKGRTPRGVKVDVKDGVVEVDVSVSVDYGMPIQKVGRNVQENVRKSVESMTGLHVGKVDVHVVGVSFDKENQEMQASQKLAQSIDDSDETPEIAEPVEEMPAEEEPAVQEEAGELGEMEETDEPGTEEAEGEEDEEPEEAEPSEEEQE